MCIRDRSLDKTKSSMDLLNFMGEQQVMLMLKLDGLTVKPVSYTHLDVYKRQR